jgi:hypothetical protein
MQLRHVALGDAGAQVLLMQSVDRALAPMRRLQWALVLITAAGLVVFGFGSVLTARRVTTPLRALVRAADRLGEGRLRPARARRPVATRWASWPAPSTTCASTSPATRPRSATWPTATA